MDEFSRPILSFFQFDYFFQIRFSWTWDHAAYQSNAGTGRNERTTKISILPDQSSVSWRFGASGIKSKLLFVKLLYAAESVTASVCSNLFFSRTTWGIETWNGTMLSQVVWDMFLAHHCISKVAKNCQKQPKAYFRVKGGFQ